MITLYVLTMVTATICAAIGCVPAALIFAAIGGLLVFGAEVRAGLRRLRRPAKTVSAQHL